MMKKLKENNAINNILILFLIIQPIFDIKIFYNSISTLIRVIIIFALFLYYFFIKKDNSNTLLCGKKKYFLLIYPILIGIYFIFHQINAMHFHSLVPGDFNYSMIKEALYFVKMLSPFLLIYCIYKAELSHDTIINIMKSLILIIGLVIILSNIFVVSYGNYSDSIIKANFFEWFNNNSKYTYKDLASKGLFEYGNQISAILIMFLPFAIYLFAKKHTAINLITLIVDVFALTLLCTRVSVIGVFIVFIYTAFAYSFVYIMSKKRFNIKGVLPICVVLLVYSSLLPINPMFNRMNERQTVIDTFKEDEKNQTSQGSDDSPENISPSQEETDSDANYIYKLNYIKKHYLEKDLHEQFFIENYPYQYDTDFWYDFLQKDISLTTNYRYVELCMVKRVVEINNNKMDKWFGITNTRLQNIFNIEKDFVVQYYALRNYWNYFSFCTLLCTHWTICI